MTRGQFLSSVPLDLPRFRGAVWCGNHAPLSDAVSTSFLVEGPSFCSAPAEPILPSRPTRKLSRRAQRRSRTATTKGEAGADSAITSRSASPPTASSSPRGRPFPPQARVAPCSARNLPFPKAGARGALPLRTARHVPTSIATVRLRLIKGIVKRLPRCPCCHASTSAPNRHRKS
jgi:hypothetical protein